MWLPTVAKRMEIAGRRQAITIELIAYQEPSPSVIEIKATEDPTEQVQDSPSMESFTPRDSEVKQRSKLLDQNLAMQSPADAVNVLERKVELTKVTREVDSPPNKLEVRPRQEPLMGAPAVSVVIPPQQSIGVDDRAVDLSNNQPPEYPEFAVQNRIEGVVYLKLHIDEQGNVLNVSIATSSGHVILDQAAVNAVRLWKGQPAIRAGAAVASEELLPIRFKL